MKFVALLFLLGNVVANAHESSDKKSEPSFEQLQGVAQYLTVLVQADVDAKLSHHKAKAILSCDPKEKSANLWLQRLKALIDVKAAEKSEKYFSEPTRKIADDENWSHCEASCLCGAYAEILGQADEAKLTIGDHELLVRLRDKQAKQSSSDDQKCAAQARWFCGSYLYQQLKSGKL